MTPMRRLSAALSAVKRSPRISIWPAVGSSSPVRQPIVVLLPDPFGPRKPNIEPFGTASERFSTATTVPYCLHQVGNADCVHVQASSFHDRHQLFAFAAQQVRKSRGATPE